MCTKKRKINVQKKGGQKSGPIPVKYKDTRCPTIACTIGQIKIAEHFLTWEQVSTFYLS